jgi:RHS repeat-associated protein
MQQVLTSASRPVLELTQGSHYRARYYDASTGRFLSEDPLRFMGDSGSFYEYVYGDSTNLFDSFGLTGQGTTTAPVAPPPTSNPPTSNPPRSIPPPQPTNPTSPSPVPPGAGPSPGNWWWPGLGAILGRGALVGLGELLLAPPTGRDEDLLPGSRNPITGRPPCGKDDKDCEAEWKAAREICRELLSRPNPPRRLTGGYKNIEDCARGFVSEACGGNPVDWGKKDKP